MHKSKIFFWGMLSFIGGIFTVSFFYPRTIESYYLFFSLIGLFIILALGYRNKIIILTLVVGGFFWLGLFLTWTKMEEIKNLNPDRRKFFGVGTITAPPERKERLQKIVIQTEKEGKILINLGVYPEYFYGDKLKIDCLLEIPENKNEEFDYRMYLAKNGIGYICQNPRVEKIASLERNRGYGIILKIKKRIEEKINHFIPAPESGLLLGLLLGGDDRLSQKIQDDFSRTGLTHIVAVSGYNVAIIAEYLMMLGIFLGLWRQQAFWLAVFGIFIFVALTGFPSSAVRAGIMGGLLLWAIKNGRLANAQNAIVLAAGLMLAHNPLLLRYDMGFQLSFLATLGIVYFYPLVEKYSIKKNGLSFFSEILFLTFSAQIFVLPIILNNFQKLSVVSLLANLLVLPIIPLTMLLGFLMTSVSFLFPPVALVAAWMTYLPLRYETWLVGNLASWKFSVWEVSGFSRTWVIAWYLILFGVIYRKELSVKINIIRWLTGK